LELFRAVERGVEIGTFRTPSRPGLTEFGLAAVLLAVLIWRPRGLTGGRELGGELRWPNRRATEAQAQAEERPGFRPHPNNAHVSGSSSVTRSREE
jgi:branched-chain amino acid transport system permease protein